MNNKEFFNSVAEKWDTICNHDRDKINQILDLLDIGEGGRILDVGTGTGILVPFVLSRVGRIGKITAVDLAEKMLEVARKKFDYPNVQFIQGDILEMELPENNYDFILCYSVFPHFADKQLAILRMSKYLKKGGKFAICHSQSREDINNLHKNASEAVSKDNLPDIDTIKGYIINAGMDAVCEVDNEKMYVIIGRKN